MPTQPSVIVDTDNVTDKPGMTGPKQLLDQWARVNERYNMLDVFRRAVYKGNIREHLPRSLLWRCLLVYGSYNSKNWASTQNRNLERFDKLCDKYPWKDESAASLDLPSDPLTDAPLDMLETQEIIRQDVNRTFPDIELFRDEQVARNLSQILLVYACINPSIGYRQGMHELAAPILWVLLQEEDPDTEKSENILSSKYTCSDAFIMFESLMKYAQQWYMTGSNPPPMVVLAQDFQETILKTIDNDLYTVFVEHGIEPQIFLIRWIRLLFSREFTFNRVLQLWDCIFAADSTLSIVTFICCTMLEKIHDQLLECSTTDILTTLLNYPSSPSEDIHSLVTNALYLKTNMTAQGGLHVRQQYQQKLARANHSRNPSRNNFKFDSLYDAAKTVGHSFPKRLPSNSYSEEDMDEVKLEYQRRNAIIGQILSNSIIQLESVHDDDRVSTVLASLKVAHGFLVNSDTSTSELENYVQNGSQNVMETATNKDVSYDSHAPAQSCTPERKPQDRSSGSNQEAEFRPKQTNRTPLRASLAQSNFSWMLGSPESRGSETNSQYKKPVAAQSSADDLFELN